MARIQGGYQPSGDGPRPQAPTTGSGVMPAERRKLRITVDVDEKNWQAEANRLFGLSLGCQNNQDAVAGALQAIHVILSRHGEVQISVDEQIYKQNKLEMVQQNKLVSPAGRVVKPLEGQLDLVEFIEERSIKSLGADVILIDDPYKDASPEEREQVRQFWKEAIAARQIKVFYDGESK